MKKGIKTIALAMAFGVTASASFQGSNLLIEQWTGKEAQAEAAAEEAAPAEAPAPPMPRGRSPAGPVRGWPSPRLRNSPGSYNGAYTASP